MSEYSSPGWGVGWDVENLLWGGGKKSPGRAGLGLCPGGGQCQPDSVSVRLTVSATVAASAPQEAGTSGRSVKCLLRMKLLERWKNSRRWWPTKWNA